MELKEDGVTLIKRGNVHSLVPSKARPSRQAKVEGKPKEPPVDEYRRMIISSLLGLLALGGLYLAGKRVSGSVKESSGIKPEDIDDEIDRFKKKAETVHKEDPFKTIFSELPEIERGVARSIVDEMKYEVLEKHPSFEGMMEVTKKFEQQIRQAARENNFSQDLALGIVFIENGGAEDLTSEAGARGPAQLMPETARRFGLQVDEEVDERIDPDKCFGAMGKYLSQMRTMFGDVGLAVWGYHAGEGNVYDALWIYFQDTKGVDLGNYLTATSSEAAQVIAQRYKEQIYQDKVSVHQVLSNAAVKSKVLNFLGDETELYPYKAVAAAEIFEDKSRRA